MRRTLLGALLLTSLAWSGPLGDAAGWIGALSGVSRTSGQEKDGHYDAVYSVANVQATLDSVRAGLMKRGWTVDTAGETMRARKDSLRLEVTSTNASVSVRVASAARVGQQVSLPANATSMSQAAPPQAAPQGKVVEGSHLSQDYTLNGEPLTMNANRSTVRVLGRCSRLIVTGSYNTISVAATVQSIEVKGTNNQIFWSAVANSRSPEVFDEGYGNRIQRQ